MKYMISAKRLAEHIIDKCARDGAPVSEDYLQKILYVLQLTWIRANAGKLLLFPDRFCASPYGPIIASVHERYGDWGSYPIDARSDEELPAVFSEEEREFVDEGIRHLRGLYPFDFREMAFGELSPWSIVHADGEGEWDEIPNELIVAYALQEPLIGAGKSIQGER